MGNYKQGDIFKYVTKDILDKCKDVCYKGDDIWNSSRDEHTDKALAEIIHLIDLPILGKGDYKVCFDLSKSEVLLVQYNRSDSLLYFTESMQGLYKLIDYRNAKLKQYLVPILEVGLNWAVMLKGELYNEIKPDKEFYNIVGEFKSIAIKFLDPFEFGNIVTVDSKLKICDYDAWVLNEELASFNGYKEQFIEDRFFMSIWQYCSNNGWSFDTLPEYEEYLKRIMPHSIYRSNKYNREDLVNFVNAECKAYFKIRDNK